MGIFQALVAKLNYTRAFPPNIPIPPENGVKTRQTGLSLLPDINVDSLMYNSIKGEGVHLYPYLQHVLTCSLPLISTFSCIISLLVTMIQSQHSWNNLLSTEGGGVTRTKTTYAGELLGNNKLR
jgi:hypothetical protein